MNGFQPVGTLGPDGIQTKPRPGDDRLIPTWGGDMLPAMQPTRQRMTWTVKVDSFNPEVLAHLFGGLFLLAWQARRINPHWYLAGDE